MWRNLDQIQILSLSDFQSIARIKDSKLTAIFINNPNFAGSNLFVDACFNWLDTLTLLSYC